MKLIHWGLCLLALVVAGAANAAPGDLVLKRVMLSTGGVAYLEFEAEVTGNADLTLDVPLDQVDDVLKSVVVYDSKGGVGTASLAGRNPLSQTFNDLPFGEPALTSPAALLNALQGAEIKVGASRPIAGQILQAVTETVQLRDQVTTVHHRVSVLTATGLQQFILEDAESVSFVDADLQAKVSQALRDIALHRAKDRRQIKLASQGTGTRQVRVGYVVGAPLWKASYRMTMPASADTEKAHLQGWAVLENMSGQEWKGVELTLLAGNPVTFRQAIYEAYYIDRPEVPVEVAGRVLPRPDTGVMQREEAKADLDQIRTPAANAAPAPPKEALRKRDLEGDLKFAGKPGLGAGRGVHADDLARGINTAEAAEGMTQVSFRLPTPITIGSGQSAIVPLLDKDIPIVRLALYQPETSAAHPLASVRLKNDTMNGLPPGVLTLYEDSGAGVGYVGDARLNGVPAGEERLVSYAVDEKTKIAREEQSTSALTRASMAQSVMHLTRVVRRTTTYNVSAPASEPRRVLLEHRKFENWKLLEPSERSVEQTATLYRATVDLKPREGKIVKFVTEAPSFEGIRIVDVNDAQIAEVAASREIGDGVKNALAELVRLRRVLAEKQVAEQQVKNGINELTADQSRIRENIAKIDKESALYKRYIEKLSQQETEFEGLQAAAAKAAGETQAARAAIDAYIAKLNI
ncbi:MAG TPA: DUF4139 domain-containing protein [Stellaceae bacterium]|nr:DUF4139 domain-containing protein [Stellaceae bacterium]